jgi:non-canonical poly(A) RNA polymerase PAPD5/7
LALEIQAFHKYVQPNRAERFARKHTIEEVRKHVQEDLPDYVVEVFGSERTGLAFALSDIDLRLTPINLITDPALAKLPPTPEKRGELKDALIELHRKFRMERRDSYILPSLRWARYPLINVQHRGSSLDIQVVLANDSSANRECMQRYIAEYDYLPQLYSVIKATMDIRGLSDVFRGGVGSYPLFMMVVASLKHMPHPRNDAAGGLINFLRFWSKFKTEEHVLSIDPPALLNKSEEVVMRGKTVYRIMVILPPHKIRSYFSTSG